MQRIEETAGIHFQPRGGSTKVVRLHGHGPAIQLSSKTASLRLENEAAVLDGDQVLTDRNLHEQDLAVMGVANIDKKSDAYAPGLVRQGDPNGTRFLSETGLWGYPSTHQGVVTQNFVTLQDVPSSYQDQHGKFVRVSPTEDKLEFVDMSEIPITVNTLRVAGDEADLDPNGNVSDERAKEEITDVDMEECVGVLRSINPVSFRYKSDPAKKHVGVLAQELQRLFPDAVVEGGEYLKVSYMELVGLLVATSKSLVHRVDALESKLDALAELIRMKNLS